MPGIGPSEVVGITESDSFKGKPPEIPAIMKKFWQASNATRFLKDECLAIE